MTEKTEQSYDEWADEVIFAIEERGVTRSDAQGIFEQNNRASPDYSGQGERSITHGA